MDPNAQHPSALYGLIDQADEAFAEGDMQRYEAVNEELRRLMDAYPDLKDEAELDRIIGDLGGH